MCLILFAYDVHPDFRLILVSNRDEFHDRPAEPLHEWANPDGLIGGRDLNAGGAWLAAGPDGRWGTVTNFREFPHLPAPRSRGDLVVEFLRSSAPAPDYLRSLRRRHDQFAGFNLLLGDGETLWWSSNRVDPTSVPRPVDPGIHGLSNEFLDTPWPKVVRGRRELGELLTERDVSREALFALVRDDSPAPDALLPSTGLEPERERALSAAFVRTPDYGTRASTLLLLGGDGSVEMVERRFGPNGEAEGEREIRW